MAGRRKTTLINMAFGYVQFAISIITGIVLVPVYLKYISVYLYGAWLTTGSVVILLTIFDPGVASLLMQNTASEYGKNNFKKWANSSRLVS